VSRGLGDVYKRQEAHRVNLLDLQSKYAEVVSAAVACELIQSAQAKESL
jgi:hypothetical protein